ncbi:MAG: response regulator transcription factor [Flavobacteriales bacterium]
MNILIIDDHTIIRRGIRNLLTERYPSARIREGSSLEEAERSMTTEAPEVAILDLLLGDGNTLDHLVNWRTRFPQVRLLIYSMMPEHLYAERVISLGCAGFLSKQGPEQELLQALEVILSGQVYASEDLKRTMRGSGDNGVKNPLKDLSDREIVVMHDLLQDLGIKEISQRMDISPSTVATYKARLFDKLGIGSVTELHRWARIHGIGG